MPTRRIADDISELKAASNRLAEALLQGTEDFFASPTLEQLAEAQGTSPLGRTRDLAGGWPSDDNIDEFLDLTYRNRR